MESPVSTASQTGAFNPATPNTTVKHIFLAFILAAWALPGHASCNDRIAVVPRPASVTESKGSFRMTGRTPVVLTDERLRGPAEIFARAVGTLTGTAPAVTTRTAKNAVTLRLAPGFDTEEYLLEVTKKGIAVTASTPQAVLHSAIIP